MDKYELEKMMREDHEKIGKMSDILDTIMKVINDDNKEDTKAKGSIFDGIFD